MSTSEYQAPSLRQAKLPKLRGPIARAAAPVSAEVWALAGLIALAAAIRIITINNQSFWMDESLTAYEAHLPFGAMLHTVSTVETTPPLYFLLIWSWAKVFGTSEIALRSLSTVAGIALVPMAYLCARELRSRRAGLIAAALVTVNPFLIWYSQEARAYMLLAALTGAGFLWFIRARRDPTRRNVAWWAVFSALALMTHFFAGFAVAPEALWLLWISRTRMMFAAAAAVTAVQLAMLPFAVTDTGHGTGWIGLTPRLHRISVMISEWAVSILDRRVAVSGALTGAGVLVVIVTLLVLVAGDARTRQAAKVGALVGGFVIIVPLVLGYFGQDYFLSRNAIPAFVPVATLIAVACTAPRAPLLGGLLAVALLALFSYGAITVQTHAYLQRPNWRNVARALGPAPVPRAVIAADGTNANPLKIYLPHVNWVQPQERKMLIDEVDIVGATKRLKLAPSIPRGASEKTSVPRGRLLKGRPLPRTTAPRGTVLLSRFAVNNWVLARFKLLHPRRLDVKQLIRLAPEFFQHTPYYVLIFMQRPGR